MLVQHRYRQLRTWVSSKSSRRLIRLLVRLALILSIAPLVLQLLLAYIVPDDIRLLPAALQRSKNLLIVTAHPDDECLFFSPSILAVLGNKRDTVGALLVLSTGNNDGIGEARKKELKGSCEALGIQPKRCVALDRADIQDNPKVWWSEGLIQKLVQEHIKKWKIDAIITFDHGGVSGHINHRAVSVAISKYAASDRAAPPTYMVTTTSLPRKYSFLGDLPLTSLSFSWRIVQAIFVPWHLQTTDITGGAGKAEDVAALTAAEDRYGNKALVASSWRQYLTARRAFASHGSQYSWDRNLYLIFSRYVWFNDMVRVDYGSVQGVDH